MPWRTLVLASGLLVLRALLDASTPPAGRARSAPPAGAARLLYAAPLDANREPAEVLALLPGLGPARADALVRARPLCSWADVDRVRGIGPVTLRTLSKSLAFPALPRDCEHELRAPGH
jgi:competence protein ComEA